MRDKSYRRNYSRAKSQKQQREGEDDEEGEGQGADPGGLTDIKALLKQSGGLSLSEVLQRKNLSLADFLTGHHHKAQDLLEPETGPVLANGGYEDRPRPGRLLPAREDSPLRNRIPAGEEGPRRRLPAARKTSARYPQATTESPRDLTTYQDNTIRRRLEEPTAGDEEEVHKDLNNLVDFDEEILITTTYPPSTKPSRLSLKPRLRLPTVKTLPRRILKPDIPEPRLNITKSYIKHRKQNMSTAATPINVKDLHGISSMSTNKTRRVYATATVTATTQSEIISTTVPPTSPSTAPTAEGPSAKEEILELLTDSKGGERLTRVLAERNMSLGELVSLRERGSSQLHLADIFPNSSLSPSAPALEPFLSKSMIAPISRQIYPLKALLEGNMGTAGNEGTAANAANPPSFIDLHKSEASEEHLGIVTLFDKFSGFGGLPKVLDPKDIKKDSDGSSYFTSVISVKPTDEVFRESRAGFPHSHKRMSPVFSSAPPFEAEEARVALGRDWPPPEEQAGAGPNQAGVGSRDDGEEGLYARLPVAVRSAIMVSSCVAGTSLLVFLTILVACRLRQRRRTLHYCEERPRLPSERSISPILTSRLDRLDRLGAGSTWNSERRNSKPFQ